MRCPHPLLRVLPLAAVAAIARKVAWLPLLRLLCLGRDAQRERVDALRDVVRSLPADVLDARLALLRSLDESGALKALRVPLLHLRAMRDRLVCRSLRHDAVGASSFREVDVDGPHFLLQARPRACRDAIADWLANMSPASAVDFDVR